MQDEQPAKPTHRAASKPWWANPYLHVLLIGLLTTASEIFRKLGADEAAMPDTALVHTGIAGMGTLSVWIGILFLVLTFFIWGYVLRILPLNIAYSITNLEHVMVPLGSALFLGETLGWLRVAGIALVLCGMWIIVKPFSEAQEKL